MKKLLFASTLIFTAHFSEVNAQTDTRPNPRENISETQNMEEDLYFDRLLGDIYGVRSKLLNKGIDVQVDYTGDWWYNKKGGLKRGSSYLYNLNARVDFDGEKLYNIKGNKIDLYFLVDNGGKPNEKYVGSWQGVDNIEVVDDILKLYEAKMEQNFYDDKLSISMGLTDLNSEFYVSEAALNFIKPEFGIGTEFAATARSGPSIFPNSALATRIRIKPSETTYIQTGVFDAVALSAQHKHGTDLHFNKNDGILMLAEGGYINNDDLNKFAVAAWKYSKKFDDIYIVDENGDPKKSDSYGFYILTNYQIYNHEDKKINCFFDIGVNEGDIIQTSLGWRGGIQVVGFIPYDKDAEIGIAASEAKNSSKFIKLNEEAETPVNGSEYGIEIYYRDEVYQGITIQPDVQYIINPSTDKTLKNALLFGIRAIVNF